MTEWSEASLEEYLDRITYGFTNPMPTVNSGPFMITAKDVNDGRILYEQARCTSLEAYKNLLTDKSRPRVGDVLVTKDGSQARSRSRRSAQVGHRSGHVAHGFRRALHEHHVCR
jgi:hypothetical protein